MNFVKPAMATLIAANNRGLGLRKAYILLAAHDRGSINNSELAKELRESTSLISADIKDLLRIKMICVDTKKNDDGRKKQYKLTRLGYETVVAMVFTKTE